MEIYLADLPDSYNFLVASSFSIVAKNYLISSFGNEGSGSVFVSNFIFDDEFLKIYAVVSEVLIGL